MVMQPPFAELARWANFYVIVGTSAGALTGLQFVVVTLLAQARALNSRHEIRAFGTPTVVHFCASLLISAIMSGPWDAPSHAGICLGALGTAGFAYSLLVLRLARKQTGYAPDAEDWLWYVALPLMAYGALGAAGFLLSQKLRVCLLIVAAVTFLFLLIGIHNAWDTVTYVALKHSKQSREEQAHG
jgi:hypothetical protein